MLAQQRGGPVDPVRHPRETHPGPFHQATTEGMVELGEVIPVDQLGIRDALHAGDQSVRGHPGRLQDLLDQRDQLAQAQAMYFI